MDNSKSANFNFRMSEERQGQLRWISETTGKSQGEILDAFIWAYYKINNLSALSESEELGSLDEMDLFNMTLKLGYWR